MNWHGGQNTASRCAGVAPPGAAVRLRTTACARRSRGGALRPSSGYTAAQQCGPGNGHARGQRALLPSARLAGSSNATSASWPSAPAGSSGGFCGCWLKKALTLAASAATDTSASLRTGRACKRAHRCPKRWAAAWQQPPVRQFQPYSTEPHQLQLPRPGQHPSRCP